jgi:hypothetical protein
MSTQSTTMTCSICFINIILKTFFLKKINKLKPPPLAGNGVTEPLHGYWVWFGDPQMGKWEWLRSSSTNYLHIYIYVYVLTKHVTVFNWFDMAHR